MKFRYRLLIICCTLLASAKFSLATHYRAGEVLYQYLGNFKFQVTVITYSKWSAPSNQADRNQVVVSWGDGAQDTIGRVNGPDIDPPDGYPDGVFVAADIKKNIYTGIHTYPGVPPPPNRFYLVEFYDQNRMASIANISNSVDVPFYVEDTIKFPTDLANIGFNSSPILLNPPIDYANIGQIFYHNPNAYDPNGDSLDFKLIAPLQDHDLNVPLYSYPDQYCIAAGEPNCTFVQDKHTGQITWNVPCQVGIFNIAFVVHEYRNGINLGTLIRDMQIIVLDEPNNPPVISAINDTCIRAGDTLNVTVTATDPQSYQTVTLEANGSPFYAPSPATFDSTKGNPATGHFHWNTVCDDIRKPPYLVVFKASDNYQMPGPDGPTPAPLVDIKPWQITVIPPPPLNLTATATNQSVQLIWQNPYKCAGDVDFRGFSVWRKTGCDLFTPEYCETGLAGRGYTKLTGANIFTYNYSDNTAVVGQQYTYRVVAHFSKVSPNGIFYFDALESVPSNGVCVFMPVNVPVMLNVDVQQTDIANGKIFVRWSKPLAGGNNLDTIQNPPPYRFDLYRGNDFNFSNPLLVYSSPDASSFSSIVDTTFTDTNLDTKSAPWSYKVLFFSNNDTVGSTPVASSIYLNVESSDQSLFLHWNENVPWTNDSFAVYKFNKLTSVFSPVDTVYNHFYTDTGLINDSVYCYYVKGYGHYELNFLPRPLINNSQEDCGVPIDTVAPCPPVLNVRNDCDQYAGKPWDASQFINYLAWSNADTTCSFDINRYYVYFGNDSSELVLIDSVLSKEDTTYNHVLNESLAGCYAVKAVDRVGNVSRFSNIFCIDNCPYYVLPNTFTPNGDGANDIFHPFHPYRFVPKIEMKIFNRWGEEIFSTEDPEINWNGREHNTGKECSEGVYVYAGYYYEQHQSGLVKKPLSGEKKGGGFIHLIRGK
jgi:gliding motility-associated-like protein